MSQVELMSARLCSFLFIMVNERFCRTIQSVMWKLMKHPLLYFLPNLICLKSHVVVVWDQHVTSKYSSLYTNRAVCTTREAQYNILPYRQCMYVWLLPNKKQEKKILEIKFLKFIIVNQTMFNFLRQFRHQFKHFVYTFSNPLIQLTNQSIVSKRLKVVQTIEAVEWF